MGILDRTIRTVLGSPLGASSGGGGGSALTVQDEGSTLSAAVTSINFVGSGVTATGGANVTVTIPSGANTALSNLASTAVNANLTHGTAGTAWQISTLNNGAGSSGNLTLRTGTATATRGSVVFEATSVVFNANNTTPTAANTVSIGTAALFFRDTSLKDIFIYTSAGADSTWIRGTATTTPSGTSVNGAIQRAPNSTTPLALYTPNKAGSGNTDNILIETGNMTSGAFNSGNISLLVGTSTGTQGSIKFLKSGVASVSGQIWTASSTDGTGYWANPGANTTLANLGTTAINADLTFDKASTAIIKTKDAAGAITRDLILGSGDVTSGAFASGNVTLKSGTSTGTRGTISIDALNVNFLTTKINSDLIGALDTIYNLGTGALAWGAIYVAQIRPNTGNILSIYGDAGINYDATAGTHDFASTGGGIVVPRLSADPGAPIDGEIWYNTTSTQLKAYVNGATVVLA